MKNAALKLQEKPKSSLARKQKKDAHFFSSGNFFQPKLTVAPANDPLEQQADEVASMVMRKSDPAVSFPALPITVQRKCDHCSEEEEKIQRKEDETLAPSIENKTLASTDSISSEQGAYSENISPLISRKTNLSEASHRASSIQRKCDHCKEEEERVQKKESNGDGGGMEAPSIVSDAINTSGQALTPETRSFMESRFGYDFGSVRVHTDSLSARSAQSIQALAYTSGNHIVFNHGQYAPGTETGDRLLAHELTHVIQQGGNGVQRSKNIQKASVYWNPVGKKGDDIHEDVLQDFGTKNKGGLFSEVPVPNAKTAAIDTGAIGTIGYADFLKTNGNLVGIVKVSQGMFENLGNIKLRKQILLEGKKFSKEKFRDKTAPVWDGGSQRVKKIASAPTQIWLGDLKPYDETIIKAGLSQLSDYQGGFNIVKDEVNAMIKKGDLYADSSTPWNITYSNLTGLAIPDQYVFPTAAGQKSKELLITFGFSGAFLEALKKAGDLKRLKEYEDIRNNNKLPGKLYVVEDGNGIYTYAHIPDVYTNPSTLTTLPGGSAAATTPPFADLMQIVNNDIKGKLSGTSFALKKSIHSNDAAKHSSAPVQTKPIVQRKTPEKQKEYKDTFDKGTWDTSLETYNTKFTASLKEKEMRNLILYGDQIHAYDELRSNLPNAKMPALSTDVKAPAKLLKSMEVWTYPGVGLLGFFRKIFGKTFVGVVNTFEYVKHKISDLAKKKDSGSVGSVTAAALRVILKVIKLIGNYVVSTSLGLVVSSLKEGVVSNFKKLAENLLPDEVEAKIQEFQDIKAKYEEYAEKTVDQWKKDFFGTWIDDFEQIERIREKVEPIVSTIEKMVRWGAGILACASPPAIGCLWNIFKEIGMYFIAKIIQTCWFGKKITGFIVKNFKFIQELPVTIANGIAGFANKNIPLPKGMDPLFAEVKVNSGDYNMTCDDFEGEGGEGGGHRGEIYELIEEIGEDRFKAFLDMMQKRGAGPWVLLTPERLKAMKDDLKKIEIADLQKLAKGETPENGVPVAVEEFLKDISKYTAQEQAVKKEFFDKQKAKQKAEETAGNGGTGKDDKSGDTGTKNPTVTGTVAAGVLTGKTSAVSAAYSATIRTAKPTPSALPTNPVSVDLNIYIYKGQTLEKLVKTTGFMLKMKSMDADVLYLEVPENTLIKYPTSSLGFEKGMIIDVKQGYYTFQP